MFTTTQVSLTKRWFIYLVLQLVGVYGFAQVNLSGTVSDQNGNTLPGASIRLKGTYLGTSSNRAGKYQFKNLKAGSYRLKVSFLGYESIEKEVNLNRSKEIDFQLKTQAIMSEEVIVAATRANSKTPVASTTLKKDDVEESNTGQDIPYQLSLTPSAVATSEAGAGIGPSAMRIRGTDASRINITVNGVPLNDAESQGVYWVNMPDFSSSVDNVQIQRGVGTSTNGSAAFGASINFKTKGVQNKPYAEIQNVAGSFNTFRNSFKAGTGLINNKFSFDARYSRLKSDGFVDRAFSDHESLFLSANYYSEHSLVKFNIIHGDQRTGISWWGNPDIEKYGRTYNPAGEYTDKNGKKQYYDGQTDNYKQTHYQLFFSHELSPFFNLNTALHYTRGDGHYEQFKEGKKYSSYGLPNPIHGSDTIKKTNLIRQKKMANDFYGATASLNYNKNRISASLGAAWNSYDGDHFGEVLWAQNGGFDHNYQWYMNTGKKDEFSLFTKLNYQINEQLNAFADLQFRHINYKMDGTDDDLIAFEQEHKFDFFNPKAGLFYNFSNRQNAYFSFGVAQREPTRANFKDAKGDPNAYPKAEKLYDYELGYNYKLQKASFGVNLYYMDYKDQLVPTGEKSSVGYDIMTNVAESYRAGIELMWGVNILSSTKITNSQINRRPLLKWEANLSLSRNKIKDFTAYATYYDADWNEAYKGTNLGETNISYSPEIIGSSIITYSPLKNLNVSFISKYVGEQYFDNTQSKDRKLPAYHVHNIRLDYSIHPKPTREIVFNVQLNNLFNKEYENNAYGGHWYEQNVQKTWAYYFPQAGINFLAGVTFKF